jgi:arylsulfatase A-like enzyme/Flp pilus assembly protein TadD
LLLATSRARGSAGTTLLCLLALAACRDRGEPPSLLLVTVDTLRADRLGAYGRKDVATPRLDALAARGALFEEALASVPLTLPSHATILSGLEPPRHGVRDNGTYVFPDSRETLATVLRSRGYRTGAFVGAYVLDRRFGLARGFDVYDDRIERRSEGGSALESERPGEEVAAAAERWIGQAAVPFFAWVHLYDPHAPYAPPSPHREEYAGRLYDGEVAYADACIGRLLDAAERRAKGRLLVAVTADHGEALHEHGEPTHGLFVYQSTLRVPMLLAGPKVPRGVRRSGPARTSDVTPTLLSLLGVPAPQGLDGRDLLQGPLPRESYAETFYPRTFGWAPLFSYRLGALKLVDAPRPELYDLGADPGEDQDLADRRPDDVARLRQALAAFRGEDRPRVVPSLAPEVAERLRALGYAGEAPPPPTADETLRDPKDALPSFREFEEAAGAEARGDLAAAAAGYRRLVEREPDNPVFRRSLAAALRRAGLEDEAARVAGEAEREAANADLAHERALALAGAGRVDEAIRAEAHAIAMNPQLPEPHNHLAVLEARRGRPREALAAVEEALRLDPNNAQAWNNRGNILRALGQREEAGAAYRRAAELAPRYADPLNGLGVLAVEDRDLGAAAHLFERVLALDPRYSEARLNLAVVEASRGRPAAARALVEGLLRERAPRDVADRARALLRTLPR